MRSPSLARSTEQAISVSFGNLILPSMKPALATIGLFIALGYWNEWYYSSLFLDASMEYRPSAVPSV